MYLKSLSLINFKNYGSAELAFSGGVNCFTGENGSGKTNLLDAIHYVCLCKGFLNPIDSQNIRQEAPFFVVQGIFELNGETEEVYCGLKKNQKKQFKRNKKEYSRLSDHIGLFPLVIVSPSDQSLILEGSEARRKFIDSVISQFDKQYLEDLVNYNRALAQRNALLKKIAGEGKHDNDSLEIWNEQLNRYGTGVFEAREKFIRTFIPVAQKYYEILSGGKEKTDILYQSQLTKGNFIEQLRSSLKRDIALEYTTVGIHKDDLEFLISGLPLKRIGSQGQQKSFVIALKLAEFERMREIKQDFPLLLLDDIYDKLDENRVNRLMQIVSKNGFGQLFITDTHRGRIEKHLKNIGKEINYFEVKDGVVEEDHR